MESFLPLFNNPDIIKRVLRNLNFFTDNIDKIDLLPLVNRFIPGDNFSLPEGRSVGWNEFRFRFITLSSEYRCLINVTDEELNNLDEKELGMLWQTTEMLIRKQIETKMKMNKLLNTGYQLLKECIKAMQSVEPVPTEKFRKQITDFYIQCLTILKTSKSKGELHQPLLLVIAEIDTVLNKYKTMQEVFVYIKDLLKFINPEHQRCESEVRSNSESKIETKTETTIHERNFKVNTSQVSPKLETEVKTTPQPETEPIGKETLSVIQD